MSNNWQVYKVINFDSSKKWEGPLSDDGYSLFGIHDREGRQCILAPKKDWVGCIRHGSNNTLQTIAGGAEYKVKLRNSCTIRNPYELMLPSICWMDYCQGMLYITDMIGDLIVLAKS